MLHNTQEILRFEFDNSKAYTVLINGEYLYLLSIVSEANYQKMLGNLPEGYVAIHKNEYQSFFYVGKILPQILSEEKSEVYELLDAVWQDLLEVKTQYSVYAVYHESESSLT